MTLAAGILFATKSKPRVALFLKRGPGGDYPGSWCFPGGRLEEGETIRECAEREAKEEVGSLPSGSRSLLTRTITEPPPSAPPDGAPGSAALPAATTTGGVPSLPLGSSPVDFTTFLQEVDAPFEVKLDGEHVGHAWAPIDEPPQPLHPGCGIALERLTMNELDVARAMAAGRLTSPQVYSNVTLWAIRITGTGVAYRKAHDEFVFREPEMYLNDDFLARCNGLAVIFEHPKNALLDSKEFSDRAVGSILLPYIKGDEVWGIAKVYDASANKIMTDRQLSTSPAVTWKDLSVNLTLRREDGSKLLVEGEPSLLDHIAICDRGVWDKGGEPSGVLNNDLGVNGMPDIEEAAVADKKRKDEEAEEKRAKADAEAGEKLDKLLSGIDSLGKQMDSVRGRMDAFEEKEKAREDAAKKDSLEDIKEEKSEAKTDKKRKDEETEEEKKAVADKKRKDEDEDKEEEKERKDRADAARADAASIAEIRQQVEDVAKKLPRQVTDDERAAFADAQSRADGVFCMLGKRAPQALMGESLNDYRIRLARQLKAYSPTWKAANIDVHAVDSAGFGIIEDLIYKEARIAAERPTDLADGIIREHVRIDSDTGQRTVEFYAPPGTTFIRDFRREPMYVLDINDNRNNRAAA